MPLARAGMAAVLLVVAVVVQVSVLSRLPLPGATPDLVLVVVIGLALSAGSTTGAVSGFFGGVLLDAVPPSDSPLGQWALVLCLVGWVAGRLDELASRSAVLPVLIVAFMAPAALLGYAALGLLLGDPRVMTDAVLASLPSATLYDVLLAPFVLPLVRRLCRWAEPRAAVY